MGMSLKNFGTISKCTDGETIRVEDQNVESCANVRKNLNGLDFGKL